MKPVKNLLQCLSFNWISVVPNNGNVYVLWFLSLATLKLKSVPVFLIFSFQVAHFKEYIPQAFPGGHSMILDAEVLLIDTKTSKPLPFGTLGVHKVRRTPGSESLMSLWTKLIDQKEKYLFFAS